jgi:hypothetical protein
MPLRRDQYITYCAAEVRRHHGECALEFVESHIGKLANGGFDDAAQDWAEVRTILASMPSPVQAALAAQVSG